LEVSIPACEPCGTVLTTSSVAKQTSIQMQANQHLDAYPILHGVFGGNTGLRDSVMPHSADAGSTSLGVVDACQGQFSLEELHGWLEHDSIVLYTSSKFPS